MKGELRKVFSSLRAYNTNGVGISFTFDTGELLFVLGDKKVVFNSALTSVMSRRGIHWVNVSSLRWATRVD